MNRKRLAKNFSSEEASINLTPLIDVVFVVLILFIIIAPLLEVEKVELANRAAKEQKKTVMESSKITIHVHADNSIWINAKQTPTQQLPALLKTLKQTHSTSIPQLYQDKKAYFGTYQTVKNMLEIAGFEELDLILEPQ